MKNRILLTLAISLYTGIALFAQEKTAFQVSDGWSEDYDVRSDIAIVYGINDAGGNFEARVKSWRDKGYQVHFMTGIAWGQYKEYFNGKFDGVPHKEEGQVMQNGETIWHGKDVPYIVPTAPFLTYMKSHIKRAIDAGVTGIFLEEPEFWARAGYSETFKKEWQKYFGFPWMAQHESPEATYLSSKLKYQLYFNALKDVFAYAKSYSESKGKRIKCYVPTHSLLNYSSWRIVSPEASLADLPGMDGYIAQVWTGTSREPVFYNGVRKERVFENAFLEYGSMVSMTAPTGKKVFFLTDPIEDWPRSWDDYKKNYQATFTAQLLYPMVADYEVMPWPPRIYRGKFKVEGKEEKQPISPAYATQMQIMVNSLNEMPLSKNKINGTHGIAVAVSNSMMFQRFPEHKSYTDPQLSNFYGLVMPLLKRGIPVQTVHLENLKHQATLKDTRVLMLSYSNFKPVSADNHIQLAKWIKNGGVLIYYGRDEDPFQTVKEWWNSDGMKYSSPSAHLFQLLNIKSPAPDGEYSYGKGKVIVVRRDPKELVLESNQDLEYLEQVRKSYEQYAAAGKLQLKNYFLLNRGPYTITSVLDENSDTTSLHIKNPVIDLFNPLLPVLEEKIVRQGEQAFLYRLTGLKSRKKPLVLATAARVSDEKFAARSYSFTVKSPSRTNNSMRIFLPAKPQSIKLIRNGETIEPTTNEWEEKYHTCLLQFENESAGIQITINW